MTTAHFDRSLRALQRRKPFKAFTVELVSGEKIKVDHPEALVLRDGVAVFVAKGGYPILFDHEGVSQLVGQPAKPASS